MPRRPTRSTLFPSTTLFRSTMERLGHTCFYLAGELDTPPERSRRVPEAFWEHPEIDAIQAIIFAQPVRPPEITSSIHRLTASRSEEHTSELQSLRHLVCRLL